MKERSFIEELYQEKAKNDSNSKSLANLLNILTKTVFGDANRFIFELIQNADDASQTIDQDAVEIELRLLENHLIFSHSGKHFTENDVRGISNVGSGDSGKAKDINKTGYKGIGFKSIFGTCDQVYIVSNNFTFKFDKNYELWKERNDYPWQVIPLWFDRVELDIEVLKLIDDKKVNIIVPIKDRKKIEKEIYKVFEDERIILFLRNINKIRFIKNNSNILELEYMHSDNIKDIYVNQELKSSWLCKDFILEIPLDVKNSIKSLDSAICPEKIKEACITKITFAALVKNNELKTLQNDCIFCYLPTKVSCDFDYLINGDFITNAERTQILDNEWNNFIFKQVAICNIKWLAELARTKEYRYEFPKLVKNRFDDFTITNYKASFNEGLKEALQAISFIPMQGNDEIFLKAGETVLDTIEFSSKFKKGIVELYFQNKNKVAECKIKYQQKLISLGIKTFKFKDIYELINMELFEEVICSDLSLYKKFIIYLHEQNINHSGQLHITELAKTKFLLDDNNELNTPYNLYFPLKDNSINISSIIDIRYINTNLYNEINKHEEIIDWLRSIGVKMPYEIDIFRNSIVSMFDNKISEDNAIIIGRFIFNLYLSGKLNDKDYIKLSKLKILTTKNHLQEPKECYLPNMYQPSLKIEDKMANGIFVSEKYVHKDTEIIKWKEFFVRIGVREKINVIVEESIERKTASRKYPLIQSYLDYIDRDGSFYDNITKYYINSSQHGFNYFTYIHYIEYCSDYQFALEFWRVVILDNWKKIYSNCLKAMYYTKLRSNNVIPFFQYYVKNFPCIPGNDKKCYKSSEIYSNNLKEVLKGMYPTVSDTIVFNKEQEEFLEIKNILRLEDCMNLISLLDQEIVNSEVLKQITLIYKHLEKSQISNDFLLKEDKLKQIKLLATDDTFQPVEQLYYFDVKNLLVPVSEKFIKIPDLIKEKNKICNLLGIKTIKKEDLQFETIKAVPNCELADIMKCKAKYFAMIISNTNAKDPQQVLKIIYSKLKKLEFYSAEILSLVFYDEADQEVFRQNIESWFCNKTNAIYYTGHWKNPLTLYSLSNSLSNFLEMDERDREVSLVMQLSNNEIEEWLLTKGYEMVELEEDVLEESLGKDCDLLSESIETIEVDFEIQEESKAIDENELVDEQINNYNDVYLNEYFYDSHSNNLNEKYIGVNQTDKSIFSCKDSSFSKNYKEDFKKNVIDNEQAHKSQREYSDIISNQDIQLNNTTKRLLSYVKSNFANEDKQNSYKSNVYGKEKVIELVNDYEKQNGRELVNANIQNEPYIISKNKQTGDIERYIKTFGFLAEWNNYDMPVLSSVEIEFAKEKGNKFWIYVLEFIEAEKGTHLYRIQNPIEKVTTYAFDHGWRSVAESKDPADEFMNGKKIMHDIHGQGEIIEQVKRGESIFLKVRFEKCEKRIPLNLTQMQIIEE